MYIFLYKFDFKLYKIFIMKGYQNSEKTNPAETTNQKGRWYMGKNKYPKS